jgi:hypothetical protein
MTRFEMFEPGSKRRAQVLACNYDTALGIFDQHYDKIIDYLATDYFCSPPVSDATGIRVHFLQKHSNHSIFPVAPLSPPPLLSTSPGSSVSSKCF